MNLKAKINQLVESKKAMTLLSFLGVYLLSAGLSLAYFSYTGGGISYVNTEDARSQIADLPKTEECPINGQMFSRPERDIWETRRPITAMIENHADSRPLSGISKADVVYEAVAEGGITRFLGVFYCGAAAEDVKIAPVRSARVYYIDWASEYGDYPIFMHVGGANDYSGFGDTVKQAAALELLETLGWRVPGGNDLDTTYDSGFPIFWRNYERLGRTVATEHTMMASLDAAYEEAEDRGFTDEYEGDSWMESFTQWEFTDASPLANPSATRISFGFWDNQSSYDVTWTYDAANNKYLRSNGGKEFTDHETKEQISASNVVIMFVDERGPVDRNKHILYTTVDEGDALIFTNGGVIEGTWEKESRAARTIFYDESGDEVAFTRGKIWIEAVPAGNDIDY